MREIILSIIGLLSPVSLIILIVGYFIRKHKRFKKYYEGIINSPKALKPVDIMGIRGDEGHGFRSYYFERNEVDGEIRRIVNDRKHVLITGKPLSGKTRLIYQTMKMLGDNYVIVIPRMVDIDPSEFLFPPKTVQKKIMIVVFDDLDKFAGKQNFQFLMEGLLKQGAMIVATVRSGPEHERLRKTLETGHSLIFSQRFEIPSLSEDEASVIAKETGRGLSSGFDGTAGSIFLGLEAMKGRFDECSSVEKSVLKCIKRLYYSGVYLEREVFSLKQIRNLGRVWKQLELSQYQWDEIVENLEKVGFITVEGEKVFADKAYLEYVIPDRVDVMANMKDMFNIFNDEPDALMLLGKKAIEIGKIDVSEKEYMIFAVETLRKVLDFYTFDNHPVQYATAQNHLGLAYFCLGVLEDRVENCKMSINAYNEALRVWTISKHQFEYASSHNELMAVYSSLAEVENKVKNSKMAIEAGREAIKIIKMEEYPVEYARIQGNIGNAYEVLAEAENRKENCIKSIEAFSEALKPISIEKYPIYYFKLKMNLGITYTTFSDAEDKVGNCKKAIESFNDALKVEGLKEKYPKFYALVQLNLGGVYSVLASVEKGPENCEKGLSACQEALKIFTLTEFPIQYAKIYIDVGILYRILATIENREENCKKAKDAFNEALRVFTEDAYPEYYNNVMSNIGKLRDVCGG